MNLKPCPKTTDTAWDINSNYIESEQYELQEEVDNLSDITEEADLDPNFNSDDSEFGEESGSSSDNSNEIIQAEGGEEDISSFSDNHLCFFFWSEYMHSTAEIPFQIRNSM
ncbi:hypothetical protein QE152_g35072 [Popillia japonica]|uniref:Uncharacterized protein n=1 Tax=Popillia japonica TaxID=7064 RepID=A0AAW1ISQ8_POPJA